MADLDDARKAAEIEVVTGIDQTVAHQVGQCRSVLEQQRAAVPV
jgi:hypothetical protein